MVLTRSSAVAERKPIDLVLASASPRRADLLTEAGYTFRVEPVEIDETAARSGFADGDIVAATGAIARAKFAAFSAASASAAKSTVLTADTLVACRGATMGKPDSPGAVAEMLAQMSGQSILITTAICVGSPGDDPQHATVSTTVQLTELTPNQVDGYVQANVGLDKAAGLALQAEARPFIATLDRCWSNVLGLPMCAVHALLETDPGSVDEEQANYEDRLEQCCKQSRCGTYLVS